jgi:hypothetical protein
MDTFSTLLLVGLGVFAVLIGGLVWWWYSGGPERLNERRTTGWPLVSATVENYEIEYSRYQGFTTILYYSYSVNGEFYSGEFRRYSHSTQVKAGDTGERWVHRQILVRHKPDDPAKSMFIENDSPLSAHAAS